MRQLLMIASLVGLVMYAGFVSQHGSAPASAAQAAPGPLAALQRSFSATGGTLRQVQITGWVQVNSETALQSVTASLGWDGGASHVHELREAKIHKHEGLQFLSVRWVLQGDSAPSWQAKYAILDRAVAAAGRGHSISVQLEGTTTAAQPQAVAAQAMNALSASGRQPWSDSHAASIAGRTSQLPAGPFGVNVQVAVRKEPSTKGSRVWVAWPALQQEY